MKYFIVLACFIGLALAQIDSRCPRGPNDSRPDTFGHPKDCRRFFRCFNGAALELSCPSGKMWSTHSNTCEPEHIADCRIAVHPIQPPVNEFHQCPRFDVPGEFVYFPHRTDCRQFYQCSGGRAVQLECPPGFMWNVERTFCDQERNVRCTTPRN